MKSKVIVIVAVLLFCGACGTEKSAPTDEANRMGTQAVMQDTQEEKDVEINIISLDICPELSMARLTYDIKVLKEMAHPDSFADEFYQSMIVGSHTQEELTDDCYRHIVTGTYTVSTEELEKVGAGCFFRKMQNNPKVDASKVKNNQMTITSVPMKQFEAADGDKITVSVKLSPLGGRIESEQEWQEDQRAAYVIVDFKDGSSEYVTRLPAIVSGIDKKRYDVEEPEEVRQLSLREDGVFMKMAGMSQPDYQSLTFHFDEDIDVDSIEDFRLIIQELE
ncbi:MAG: hypothetical protein NC123_20590 [Butyrivibrio sp.]|nr:hypothetical protein [Butyrivibrio sp.]